MFPTKIVGSIVLGGGVGAVTVLGLREKMDKPQAITYAADYVTTGKQTPTPFLSGQLLNFGSPSAVGSLILGAAAILGGWYANKKGKLGDMANAFLIAFGGTTAIGGLVSGLYPTNEWLVMTALINPASASSSSGSTPNASATLQKSTGSGSNSAL